MLVHVLNWVIYGGIAFAIGGFILGLARHRRASGRGRDD
jgi:hypothetical protein